MINIKIKWALFQECRVGFIHYINKFKRKNHFSDTIQHPDRNLADRYLKGARKYLAAGADAEPAAHSLSPMKPRAPPETGNRTGRHFATSFDGRRVLWPARPSKRNEQQRSILEKKN